MFAYEIKEAIRDHISTYGDIVPVCVEFLEPTTDSLNMDEVCREVVSVEMAVTPSGRRVIVLRCEE